MASSSSQDRQSLDGIKLDELKATIDMNCSICYELFSEPLLLRCGHTFCKGCTDRLISSAYETAQQRYHYGTPTMTCPECRAEMPADRNILVKNYRLADIINDLNSLQTDSKESKIRSPESKPSNTIVPGNILCPTCKELIEPKNLLYCLWCSNGRPDPCLACAACFVRHHNGHKVESYGSIASQEERQAFVNEAINKIRDAASQLHTGFDESLRVPPEYQNLRTTLQDAFIHWEPVLANARTNPKLTKKQIEEQTSNIGNFINTCRETVIQLRNIENKHISDIITLREKFSTNVAKALENFTNVFTVPSSATFVSFPSTSSAPSEANSFSFQPSGSRYRHRLTARRRRNLHSSTSTSGSQTRNNNASGDGDDDDDL